LRIYFKNRNGEINLFNYNPQTRGLTNIIGKQFLIENAMETINEREKASGVISLRKKLSSKSFFYLPFGWNMLLKGQCHEVFDFRSFTWIRFSQAPDYTIRAISNFFENSRRYSQLMVKPVANGKNLQSEKFFIISLMVVDLDFKKSPRIFEKIRNDPSVIFRGLGEDDS
jgi:hypothetical protein